MIAVSLTTLQDAILGFGFLAQETLRSTAEERWSFGGIAFADPWFLLLIPAGALWIWFGAEARRVAAARVPTIGSTAEGAALSSRAVLWIPAVVRFLALALFAISLSRPLEGRVSTSQETEGIDIALLLDRSSSMNQRERADGPRRFDVVKEVVADFATRRMTDAESARDNVALFGFAFYADLLVPFTLDADAIQGVLAGLDTETVQTLDGTAIGDSLLAAVAVLQNSKADSRVVVLLTDGNETASPEKPMIAAKAALEAKVRVYTVYAGPREVLSRSLFGDVRRQRVDVGELPKIAEFTGGRFFHAANQDELEEAYAAIEELERTPRSEERFAERFDLYPYFLGPALLLYLLSWIFGATVGRRLP